MKKWFNNLKVAHKLMLISVFFVMPDSIMLYLFITGINKDIQFALMEKKGNEYQRPLEDLLERIPEHGLLVQQVALGEHPIAEHFTPKQEQIDAAFDQLEAIDARIGAELQFTDEGLAKRKREHYRVGTVRKEWDALKANLGKLAPEVAQRHHLHLVSDVRMMITHAGDLSNLILDPDLDSYYLMDATLLALPQTQDRIATIMDHGEMALKDGVLSHAERQQFAIYASLLEEADLDRISSSVQTALNEDPNFYGVSPTLQANVPPALVEYIAATKKLVELTNRIVNSEKVDVTAAAYLDAGTKARDASFKLWRIADDEVDRLLQIRIDSYRRRRMISLLVAFFALCAAISFVTFITRSISGPLRQQAAELTTANKALQIEIADRKRAEETTALFKSLMEHSKDPLFMLSPAKQWRLTYINDAGCKHFGYTREKLLTMTVADWDIGFAKTDMNAFWNRLKSGESLVFETTHKVASGKLIPVEISCGYFNYAGEEYSAGWFRDITDRKLAAEKVEELNRQLVIAARQSGMAEVASSVLHNAGNVLNSVNVSATLVMEKIRGSLMSGLKQASDLIDAQGDQLPNFIASDPRGKQLPGYFRALAEYWEKDRAQTVEELEHLGRNVQHVKDIIAAQQSLTGVSGFEEPVKVSHVIENALKIVAASFEHNSIAITREFADIPATLVDKSKLLQILINLLQNSKDAVSSLPPNAKKITVRTTLADSRIRVAVEDNGIGIRPEDLTRIFSFGFTTKPTGHGIGLHISALGAQDMGGALSAASPGLDQGATFILELPFKAIEVKP